MSSHCGIPAGNTAAPDATRESRDLTVRRQSRPAIPPGSGALDGPWHRQREREGERIHCSSRRSTLGMSEPSPGRRESGQRLDLYAQSWPCFGSRPIGCTQRICRVEAYDPGLPRPFL